MRVGRQIVLISEHAHRSKPIPWFGEALEGRLERRSELAVDGVTVGNEGVISGLRPVAYIPWHQLAVWKMFGSPSESELVIRGMCIAPNLSLTIAPRERFRKDWNSFQPRPRRLNRSDIDSTC